jgi:hypothetical protein
LDTYPRDTRHSLTSGTIEADPKLKQHSSGKLISQKIGNADIHLGKGKFVSRKWNGGSVGSELRAGSSNSEIHNFEKALSGWAIFQWTRPISSKVAGLTVAPVTLRNVTSEWRDLIPSGDEFFNARHL